MTLSGRRPGRLAGHAAFVFSVALAAAILALLAGAAHADPVQARKHYDMGKRYFQVDEYRKAIDEFKAAHILEPDPAFLYNIAECHRRLGETDEAMRYYRRFLSLSPPGNPQRALAETRVAELEKTGVAATTPAASTPSTSAPAAAPLPTTPAPPPPAIDPSASSSANAAPFVTADASNVGNPSEASPPFYKRGWFWGLAAAVVVGAGVGVWALSSRGSETEIPSAPLGNARVFER